NAPFRDEVFQQKAPFTANKQSILKTIDRFAGIRWGNENTAIATDRWWNSRNTRTYIFDPSNSSKAPKVLFDRNYQDVYSDPGNFIMTLNTYGESVLDLDKGKAYLIGDGFSAEGKFPFIDEMDLKSQKTKRLYQSQLTDQVENIAF